MGELWSLAFRVIGLWLSIVVVSELVKEIIRVNRE